MVFRVNYVVLGVSLEHMETYERASKTAWCRRGYLCQGHTPRLSNRAASWLAIRRRLSTIWPGISVRWSGANFPT